MVKRFGEKSFRGQLTNPSFGLGGAFTEGPQRREEQPYIPGVKHGLSARLCFVLLEMYLHFSLLL